MKLLRAKALAAKLDMHRTSVYKLCKADKTFPKPIKLSSRYTAWIDKDVDDWLLSRKQGDTNEIR